MEELKKKKRVILIISISAGILGFISKLIRPWIINNEINDFSINEYAPSFFYIVGFCLFGAFVQNKKEERTMLFIAIGALIYELEQYWTSRTYDYKDILATVCGFCISILIFNLLVRRKVRMNKD